MQNEHIQTIFSHKTCKKEGKQSLQIKGQTTTNQAFKFHICAICIIYSLKNASKV